MDDEQVKDFLINGVTVKKQRINKPRTPWRSRAFTPLFQVVDLEADPFIPGLERELYQDEINVIKIYSEHIRRHGAAPRAELKYRIIKDLSIELDLPVYPSAEQYAEMRTESDDVKLPGAREWIDHVLFKDLFPHNLNIPFTTAVKRLTGFSATDTSPAECREAILFLSELLTQQRGSREPVIPTTSDIDKAFEDRLVVPALACPMPTAGTIIRRLGATSWNELVGEVLDVSKANIRKSLYVKVTLPDVVEDYKAAFQFYYGDGPCEGTYVTTQQLADFAQQGGLGYHRYRTFFNKMGRHGIDFNLNDIRRISGLPLNQTQEIRTPRRSVVRWKRADVYAHYMMAWKFLGTLEPPSVEDLNRLSYRQTPLFNAQALQGDRSNILDPAIARESKVPTAAVPAQQTILKHFTGMNQLLAFVEKVNEEPVVISDRQRLSRLAREANHLAQDQIPQCVQDFMIKRPRQDLGRPHGHSAVVRDAGSSVDALIH